MRTNLSDTAKQCHTDWQYPPKFLKLATAMGHSYDTVVKTPLTSPT